MNMIDVWKNNVPDDTNSALWYAKKVTQVEECHYFISSAFNWTTDNNLLECIEKQKQWDKSQAFKVDGKMVYPPVQIYLVPVPENAHYGIANYAPQGVEAMLIYADDQDEYWDKHDKHYKK